MIVVSKLKKRCFMRMQCREAPRPSVHKLETVERSKYNTNTASETWWRRVTAATTQDRLQVAWVYIHAWYKARLRFKPRTKQTFIEYVQYQAMFYSSEGSPMDRVSLGRVSMIDVVSTMLRHTPVSYSLPSDLELIHGNFTDESQYVSWVIALHETRGALPSIRKSNTL